MRNIVKSPFTIGMVAVLAATFSLEVLAVEAGDRIKGYVNVEYGKRLDKIKRHLKRRNILQCTEPQIPIYTGEELMCGLPEDTPVEAVLHEIAGIGQMEADIWGTTIFISVSGGEFNSRTGLGELRLAQGDPAQITYAFVTPELLALTLKWGLPGTAPSEFSGLLDADIIGFLYEGDLIDPFGNTLSFLPGIQLIP